MNAAQFVEVHLRRTFKAIAAEYGAVALVIYLLIFTLVITSFWFAIRFGWTPNSIVGDVGAFTAAYLATKVTQPLRIGATLVVTPIVARLLNRYFPRLARATSPADSARRASEPAIATARPVPPVADR